MWISLVGVKPYKLCSFVGVNLTKWGFGLFSYWWRGAHLIQPCVILSLVENVESWSEIIMGVDSFFPQFVDLSGTTFGSKRMRLDKFFESLSLQINVLSLHLGCPIYSQKSPFLLPLRLLLIKEVMVVKESSFVNHLVFEELRSITWVLKSWGAITWVFWTLRR